VVTDSCWPLRSGICEVRGFAMRIEHNWVTL
jgi:hypothetical protein